MEMVLPLLESPQLAKGNWVGSEGVGMVPALVPGLELQKQNPFAE